MSLSIIIPHYNKNEALQETWKELLLQINPDDQILIVDDHSDVKPEFDCPCTETIQPPKVTPHIYRLNTLRNYGLQHAKHDSCIILDPDCVPQIDFLKNARRMRDPLILFGGRIDKTTQDGETRQDTRMRKTESNRWIDMNPKQKPGILIYGGCMMFSRSRTALFGWFDTSFDGVWGAEEHEFASRAYHSGMRLRYAPELHTIHQWHPHITRDGYQRNRKLWIDKTDEHYTRLNYMTPYQPRVGVMVITMLRPDLITQCLSAIFRNRVALKIRLILNGDDSEETVNIAKQWGSRWAVDVVQHSRKWPAVVRNDSMRWAKGNGFKYLVFIDDDMLVSTDGVVNLLNEIEKHPEYYAMSGSFKSTRGIPERMLGGVMKDGGFYNYSWRNETCDSDWVGGGFTVHKLDPFIPYDENYQTGYNDFDWSMTVKKEGLKLGVTGLATAHHFYKLTSKGLEPYKNPLEYQRLRYDTKRHARMRDIFKEKWGMEIKQGGLWKG